MGEVLGLVGWLAEWDWVDVTYSWPVLRMTSLMLFCVAKARPLAISEGFVTLIA